MISALARRSVGLEPSHLAGDSGPRGAVVEHAGGGERALAEALPRVLVPGVARDVEVAVAKRAEQLVDAGARAGAAAERGERIAAAGARDEERDGGECGEGARGDGAR